MIHGKKLLTHSSSKSSLVTYVRCTSVVAQLIISSFKNDLCLRVQINKAVKILT
jgi:hypothetical protein